MPDRGETDDIEQSLLRYLSVHPLAMDTLEGVADWWLQTSHDRTALVRVLKGLEDRGVLETVGSGERMLYRLKRISVC